MKPIIFSTEMVQAILGGNKTQTRRVVKIPSWTRDTHDDLSLIGKENPFLAARHRKNKLLQPLSPPCIANDMLWVRETYARFEGVTRAGFIYKADDKSNYPTSLTDCIPDRWQPSIHMPKEAARLFLKVTCIRAERLQKITVQDCIAEGADYSREYKTAIDEPAVQENKYWNIAYVQPIFKQLWNSLYGADSPNGWTANPWVWVIDFEIMPTVST